MRKMDQSKTGSRPSQRISLTPVCLSPSLVAPIATTAPIAAAIATTAPIAALVCPRPRVGAKQEQQTQQTCAKQGGGQQGEGLVEGKEGGAPRGKDLPAFIIIIKTRLRGRAETYLGGWQVRNKSKHYWFSFNDSFNGVNGKK